jgi:hypothetical protein
MKEAPECAAAGNAIVPATFIFSADLAPKQVLGLSRMPLLRAFLFATGCPWEKDNTVATAAVTLASCTFIWLFSLNHIPLSH